MLDPAVARDFHRAITQTVASPRVPDRRERSRWPVRRGPAGGGRR